ncbi:hypothetical protein [Shewanella sp. GutDb-MelDb]|uniref:hypothetical protein n=1 Tax=Shewanella sp. GutDb-MelDb TaxID=2058316 RepID=UPI000C79571D|nr:hypothetical protein [Shewanella sp. GutDb-MelDb]PKG58060.1 hypothetical protein CXF82_06440 [Shewanella sp. GutDb-MelDb]
MQVSQSLSNTAAQSKTLNSQNLQQSTADSHSQLANTSSDQPISPVASSDTVTLSASAIELAAQGRSAEKTSSVANEAEILPVTPKLPNEGEKVDDYVDYRKAKAQYQFYADIAGVATGSSNLTPASAYYLSNNDDARAAVVNNKAQQQQAAVMQTYVETSQSINVYS